MSKIYKLLPVQVENLQRQHDENLLKLRQLNVVKNQELSDAKISTGNELILGMDISLLGSLSVAARDYKEAKERLGSYEIIENNNYDVIGLGSTFEINMNYDGIVEAETFTLVETRNHNDDENFISIDSPLGKSVVGSKVGDKISYAVDKIRMTGTVTGIVKEKQKTL